MRDDERRVTYILPADAVEGLMDLPIGYRRVILASLIRLFIRLRSEQGRVAYDLVDAEKWELVRRVPSD